MGQKILGMFVFLAGYSCVVWDWIIFPTASAKGYGVMSIAGASAKMNHSPFPDTFVVILFLILPFYLMLLGTTIMAGLPRARENHTRHT